MKHWTNIGLGDPKTTPPKSCIFFSNGAKLIKVVNGTLN